MGGPELPASPSGIVPDHRHHSESNLALHGLSPCAPPPQTTQRLDTVSWSTLPRHSAIYRTHASSGGGESNIKIVYLFSVSMSFCVYRGLRSVSRSVHDCHTPCCAGQPPRPNFLLDFSTEFFEKSYEGGTSNANHANPPCPQFAGVCAQRPD